MDKQEQKHPWTNMATFVKLHGLHWMSLGAEQSVIAQVEGEYLLSANDQSFTSPPQEKA